MAKSKNREHLMRLALAYYRDEGDERNADIFACELNADPEKEFQAYSKRRYGYRVAANDIEGVYIYDGIEKGDIWLVDDARGNKYAVSVKRV